MKFMSITILSTALLSGSIIAAPGSDPQKHKRASPLKPRAGIPHSKPPIALEKNAPPTQDLANSNAVQAEYSQNWAGAIYTGNGVTSVSGTVQAPTPSIPSGGSDSTEYCASAWVGLDGSGDSDSCNVILQTGIDACIQGSSITYRAWYEWYPDSSEDLTDLNIAAGDTIQMTATTTGSNGGTVSIVNPTKGTRATHTFSGESVPLCERNAEWIVEDFSSGLTEQMVPFANLGTVTFSDATATTSNGSVGAGSAQVLDIQQNGEVLTSSSVSGNSVTVEFT